MEKKLVLPGTHLFSNEEAVSGENTYNKDEEIFSSAFGAKVITDGIVSVSRKGKKITKPFIGMEVYALVLKTSNNKAVCSCVSVAETDGVERSFEITGILPVSSIRKGYVDDLRNEVKIGDVIKAKISKIEKTGVDISMVGQGLGKIYSRKVF